jgi:hypothetical protein
MPRIRTVKPEFFKNYKLFQAEKGSGFPLRVAFEGLWTVADREGRFKWVPEELKLDCLPYDEVDFSRVLDALATHGYIVKYHVDGQDYGWIPKFSDHQVINNRETESKLPEPNNTNTSTCDSRVNGASVTPLFSPQGEGKGKEMERKGKEEEGKDGKPPAPVFFKILKTCQGIRRVVHKVREPFSDPKDGTIIQEYLDQGYTPKDIQVAFFLFCVWEDKYLEGKPRTMPLFKTQVSNYWSMVQKVGRGVKFPKGKFKFKEPSPEQIQREKEVEEKKTFQQAEASTVFSEFDQLQQKGITVADREVLVDLRNKAAVLELADEGTIDYLLEKIDDWLDFIAN